MGTHRLTLLASLLCAMVLPACTGKKTVVITTPMPPTKSSVQPPPAASIPPPAVKPPAPLKPQPTDGLEPTDAPALPGEVGPPRPPALLVPQTVNQQDHDQEEAYKVRIARTEAKLALVDPTRLNGSQEELYMTIQSFLTKAKVALDRKDFLRASNLSDKALTLTDELAASNH
ncbi:MAG: hypothetical protein ACREI3_10190 [Nitrospirales bacterium]